MRARANDGLDGLVRVARKLTKLVGAAVLTYCAVVLVAGPWLLSFVYGPEFASAGNLARIGAVQYAIAVAAFGAGIAIRVARQARTMWMSRLLVTALSIVAVIALSSWFGIVGAAWAGVFTVAAATAATLLVFRAYVTSERASEQSSERAGTRVAPTVTLPPPALGTRHPAPAPASGEALPWPPPALVGHGPG